MKIQAPIEVELKISVTNGEMSGVATVGMGKGRYPTETEIRQVVADFVKNDMPEGFRLMTKREWWNTVCPPAIEEDEDGNRYRMPFAVPGGDEFEA